ncbi:MAG: cytochrome P450 [Acidimicrobiales bacterium]|nr:cytochrome P450 [Acidimicrobiales bacterium]
MTVTEPSTEIPEVSGIDEENGHLEELRTDPIGLMKRARAECGDVAALRFVDKEVVLLTGAEANETFFRASDDELDMAAAYPFMTPVFGTGVVFDATPEQRREAMHNQSLRDKYMRGHAEKIAREVNEMIAGWGDEGGDIDLLDFFAELTLYTSSTCLIGRKFREQLDGSVAHLFHDLEKGTDAMAYVDPYLDIESFRKRDAARAELVERIDAIMATRRDGTAPDGDQDLVDVLMSLTLEDGTPRYSADIVTGMFISMMFAGHHTTSGTAAWTLIELLRNPEWYERVLAEQDRLAEEAGASGEELTYQALRDMPVTEAAIKEALRLHPPLIILMRVVNTPFEVGGYVVEPGRIVATSLIVSNTLPEAFAHADAYDPGRYLDPRHDDKDNPWNWIPFGAGRHRCVGAAFAMMQLKAIFSILLRDWTFEANQPPETYQNDHSKMVVQLKQPCGATYRRRTAAVDPAPTAGRATTATHAGQSGRRWRIVVDHDLCQGHGVCEGEAPDLFDAGKDDVTLRVATPPDDQRARAELAVRYCPTHALSIVEEDQ